MYPKIVAHNGTGYLIQIDAERGYVYESELGRRSPTMDVHAFLKFGGWLPFSRDQAQLDSPFNSTYDFVPFFVQAIEIIRAGYSNYNFSIERDFVWTVQKHLSEMIDGLPYLVYNDYPIEKGTRRSKSVDLAIIGEGISPTDIINGTAKAEFVAEFKFEPSVRRKNLCLHKLPVTDWKEIQEDIMRINRFTDDGKAKSAVAVLVDEYGRFRKREIGSQSRWIDWGDCKGEDLNVSVLWTLLPYMQLEASPRN